MLQAWRQQPFSARYRVALSVVLRLLSIVIGMAGAAFLIIEPSWRTLAFTLLVWCVAVPIAALGYMRKLDRMAARVPPITPARRDPKTATDIRRTTL